MYASECKTRCGLGGTLTKSGSNCLCGTVAVILKIVFQIKD